MRLLEIDNRNTFADVIDGIAQIDSDIFSSNQWGRDSLADSAENDYDYLVAAIDEDNREPVGFGLLRVFDDAEVIRIAVDPNMRRNGIGRSILNSMLKETQNRNVENVFLEVRSGNTAARALYEGAGFVSEGIRKGYYSDPVEDAVIMRFTC